MEIGGTKLDFSHYAGSDLYSDGWIEDRILEACKAGREDALLYGLSDYAVLYHLSDIRHNLLEWYPIDKGDSVLEIGSGCGGITGVLSGKCAHLTCVELSKKRSLINAYRHKDRENINIIVGNLQEIAPSLPKYDIITLIGVWEYAAMFFKDVRDPYQEMLKIAVRHLKKDGRLLIAIENKMGLKYFNGDCEDHTGRQYSGLNDYTGDKSIRTFSINEIRSMLAECGVDDFHFYYPMNDYKLPDTIYSENYLPEAGGIRYFGQDYQKPRIYNFYEASAWDQICMDNMFPYFANSFFIATGKEISIEFAKYSREREAKFRLKTEILNENGNKAVRKTALNDEAKQHIRSMAEKTAAWSGTLPLLRCVEFSCQDGNAVCPYIDGTALDADFFPLRHDLQGFIKLGREYVRDFLTPENRKLKKFIIREDFVHVFGDKYPGEALSSEYTNVDIGLHNMKREKGSGNVYVFDTEWIFTFPIPYRFPAWRSMMFLYREYKAYLGQFITEYAFLRELGYTDTEQNAFQKMESGFLEYVCGKNKREIYTQNYRKCAMMQSAKFY